MTRPYVRPSAASHGSRSADRPDGDQPATQPAMPLYWRVLRLSAVRPNGWQRAVLVEGVVAIAVILTLADAASAWTLVVLPLVAAAVVKAHDYLVRVLPPPRGHDRL